MGRREILGTPETPEQISEVSEQGQTPPEQAPESQIWRSVLGWVAAILFLIVFALLIAYVGSLFS